MAIRFRDVSFGYRGHNLLLDGVDVDLSGGERVWVRGPNGAGKSTLLRLAIGELKPTAGCVERPTPYRYLPDTLHFDDYLTVGEQLRFLEAHGGVVSLSGILDSPWFDAEDAPDSSSFVGELSLGWRRRLALGVLFSGETPLYVLDEPTNALDEAGCRLLESTMLTRMASGAAFLYSSHRSIVDGYDHLRSVSELVLS